MQCAMVVHVVLIHLFNMVWITRNNNKFKDKVIPLLVSINFIFVASSIFSNNTNLVSPLGIQDFVVLKSFKINILPPKVPNIVEVI